MGESGQEEAGGGLLLDGTSEKKIKKTQLLEKLGIKLSISRTI